MGNDIIYSDNVATPGQVLKITALIYLKEALVKQQFEACPELITCSACWGSAIRPTQRTTILDTAFFTAAAKPSW